MSKPDTENGISTTNEKISFWSEISFIFNKKEKTQIALLLVMIIVGSFLELLGVAMFSPFISVIMDQSMIKTNRYLALIFTIGNFKDNIGFLTFIAGCIIVIYVVKNAYLIAEKNAVYKFSFANQMRISGRLLNVYMHEPYSFHLKKNVAVLQRTLQEDTELFTKVINHAMELISEVVVVIVLGVYLFQVSHSIAVCVLTLLIICVFGFTTISKKYAKKIGKECQEYKGKLYQWMNQALGGIKEVKVLGCEEYFENSYDSYFSKYVHDSRMIRMMGETPRYIVEAVSMSGMLVAVIIKMSYGQKTIAEFIPQFAVFAVAAMRLLPSVGRINQYYTNMMYAMPSVDLIYHDLFDVQKFDANSDEENISDWKLSERIRVNHVSFRYPDSDKNVLDDVNFDIRKGETVAFIGSSGAGKTTMADVILGLLTPQYGHVYADELDIHKNVRKWHRDIGYIPQTIYLSDDTIKNNIAFGVEKDNIDNNSIILSLKQAQLYDFVINLPDEIDTYVGDRGVRLSGGQRQRIGIARALYHNPQVLVLDEATSALDNETETSVMNAIDGLHGEKTLIIIAHRLTTIRNADTIYEIKDGKAKKKDKNIVLKTEIQNKK